jgi:hypothetical protein
MKYQLKKLTALSEFLLIFLVLFLSVNPSKSSAVELENVDLHSSSIDRPTTTNNVLVATPTTNVQIDIGDNNRDSIYLMVVQSSSIPTGSLIKCIISPTSDGNALIVAEQAIVNGQAYDFHATSEILVGQTITTSTRLNEAKNRSAFAGAIGGMLGLVLGADTEEVIQYSAGMSFAGALTGFLSPQRVQILNLTPGNPILFRFNSF